MAAQISTAAPTTNHAGKSGYTMASRTRAKNGPRAGSTRARSSSHVSATVSGQGGQGTSSITMAYSREAMCRVRKTLRPRVAIQPSSTQAHQTRCTKRTASTRTDAAPIAQLLRIGSYYQLSVRFLPNAYVQPKRPRFLDLRRNCSHSCAFKRRRKDRFFGVMTILPSRASPPTAQSKTGALPPLAF